MNEERVKAGSLPFGFAQGGNDKLENKGKSVHGVSTMSAYSLRSACIGSTDAARRAGQ